MRVYFGSGERHDPGHAATRADCERGDRGRQFEPPRSSTPGIDKQSPTLSFDDRFVRMAENDSREARGMRVNVKL